MSVREMLFAGRLGWMSMSAGGMNSKLVFDGKCNLDSNFLVSKTVLRFREELEFHQSVPYCGKETWCQTCLGP